MNSCRLIIRSLKLLFIVKFNGAPVRSSFVNDYNMTSNAESMVFDESSKKILTPPEAVRGMKELNRDLFTLSVDVPYITLGVGNVSCFVKPLSKYFLKLEKFKAIEYIDSEDVKVTHKNKNFLLNPDVIQSFESLPETLRVNLVKEGVTEIYSKTVTVTYDNWSMDDVLKAILPCDLSFSGYSLVGHIVHLNLRENILDYKFIIGQVIIDKLKNVKTVVNKIQNIDNTYRNFQMELLAGDNNMLVQMKQGGIRFEFDFSKVYWNPRLSTEHERIVGKLKRGDYLYDVFCGIGPFVLPAAKKGCICLANDLNPDSIHWLQRNIELNKIHKSNVVIFNKDGHQFIQEDIKKHLLTLRDNENITIHITMNLPSISTEFLSDFRALLTSEEYDQIPTDIQVHSYCFIKGEYELPVAKDLAKEMVESRIGVKLTDDLLEVVRVRTVSPNKEMFRVSFNLSREVLVRGGEKRPRLCIGDEC